MSLFVFSMLFVVRISMDFDKLTTKCAFFGVLKGRVNFRQP